MPWSGGTFTRIENWVNDKNAGIPITASRMDTDSNDFTSGINNCIAKDGSNSPTSALNAGNLRFTLLGAGTALTDAANINQVQAGVLNWGIAGGTSDALSLVLSPAQTMIADGTLVGVRATAINLTTTPTFAFNATTAVTITRSGGVALAVGDLQPLGEAFLRYNSANTRWELLNPTFGDYLSAVVPYPPSSSTVTITIAAPGVITWNSHGLPAGAPVFFTTTGALPTGFSASTTYFVSSGATLTTNTFALSSTVANALAGTSITTSGTQSGTQTANAVTQNLTTGTPFDVGGLSLTPGDWEVWGEILVNLAGSTVATNGYAWLNTASATFPSKLSGFSQWSATTPAGSGWIQPTGIRRFSVTTATNIFLSGQAGFATSSANATGSIEARRR